MAEAFKYIFLQIFANSESDWESVSNFLSPFCPLNPDDLINKEHLLN